MDLARAPCRAPLTARKKGSGYENGKMRAWQNIILIASAFSKLLEIKQISKVVASFPLYRVYQKKVHSWKKFTKVRCARHLRKLSVAYVL